MEKEAIKESMYLSVEMWQSSGMSQRAWCKQEGIGRGKFKYWLDRYHREAGIGEGVSGFVALETCPVDKTSIRDVFSITYPNGAQLHCPEGTGHGELLSLLQLMG